MLAVDKRKGKQLAMTTIATLLCYLNWRIRFDSASGCRVEYLWWSLQLALASVQISQLPGAEAIGIASWCIYYAFAQVRITLMLLHVFSIQ